MTDDIQRRQALDEEHLRLLSLFYFISAGFSAFFSLFSSIYIVIGIVLVASLSSVQSQNSNAPPEAFAWAFVGIGASVTLLALGLALLKFLTGRALRRRRSRTLCLVTAGISCIGIPYGTVLGIFTFLVLGRPSVQALFDHQREQRATT